jgi:hypothetical protein
MKNTKINFLRNIALFAILIFSQLNLLGQNGAPWVIGGNTNDAEVFGRCGSVGNLYFLNSATEAEADYDMVLTYDPSYLGIGTMTPQSNLHIHSDVILTPEIAPGGIKRDVMPVASSESVIQLTNHFSGSGDGDGFLIRSYGENAILQNQEDGDLTFMNNGLRLKLQQNGDVSIGDLSNPYFTVFEGGNVEVENSLQAKQINVNTSDSYSVSDITASGENLDSDWNKIGSFNVDNGNNALVFYTGGGTDERISFIQAGHHNGDYSNSFGILALNPFGGNVGIGTYNPDYKLDVRGKIRSDDEILVIAADFPDFVFEDDYQLESFNHRILNIKENKHLPYIATATEMEINGLPVSETIKGLTQNVEELYLYIEKLEQKINDLEEEIN